MMSLHLYRQQWFGNIRADLLSGLVVALALIPEAIAFSIIAGVDPKVGLYASFSIAVICAITGGRPGMISAATAATAVLMVTLVRDYGLEYLLAATVLAGLLQIGGGFGEVGQRSFDQQIGFTHCDAISGGADDPDIAANRFRSGIFDSWQHPVRCGGDFVFLQVQGHKLTSRNVLTEDHPQIANAI